MPTSSAIDHSLAQLQVGKRRRGWVQEAIEQPLNPELIARSVQNEDEALEVYYLSCLVIDVDHFYGARLPRRAGAGAEDPGGRQAGHRERRQREKRELA